MFSASVYIHMCKTFSYELYMFLYISHFLHNLLIDRDLAELTLHKSSADFRLERVYV